MHRFVAIVLLLCCAGYTKYICRYSLYYIEPQRPKSIGFLCAFCVLVSGRALWPRTFAGCRSFAECASGLFAGYADCLRNAPRIIRMLTCLVGDLRSRTVPVYCLLVLLVVILF